jgi:hypothetical protein
MQPGSAVLVQRKSPDNEAAQRRKSHGRSRVSNGRDVLPDVDGRSVIARRYRDILAALASDQGGADHMSEARVQLCRRFAALAVQAEQMESALARGEPIDLQQHALLASTLVRLASRIGIDRVPRDVTPTLHDYLARYVAARPADAAEGEEGISEGADDETLTGEATAAAGGHPSNEGVDA